MLKRAPVRWASVESALIVGGPCPCARAALCRSGSARDGVAAAQQSCDFVGADCTLRRAGMAFCVQEPPRNSARGFYLLQHVPHQSNATRDSLKFAVARTYHRISVNSLLKLELRFLDHKLSFVLIRVLLHLRGGTVCGRLGAICTAGRLLGDICAVGGRLNFNRLYRVITCRE